VLYKHCPTIADVDTIAQERGYRNRDQVCVSPEAMGDVYEDKVKMFFAEHLHEDEEIRYITDGEGYFDVRGQDDEWIRICLVKDDMIILPAGIYHRFTTNEQNVSLPDLALSIRSGGIYLYPGTDSISSMSGLCVSSRMSPSGRRSIVVLRLMGTLTARRIWTLLSPLLRL
jgi:mannose-6-phosphate isomerase-like protein (cupin superfamily)